MRDAIAANELIGLGVQVASPGLHWSMFKKAPHVRRELIDRRIAGLRLFTERHQNNAIEICIDRAVEQSPTA